MSSFIYNGVEIQVPEKTPAFTHSVSMMIASFGKLESNADIPYYEKLVQYKETDLPEGELLHDTVALYTLQQINYQIQNGGFEQYYDNGYHIYRSGHDIGDLSILDINEQIMFFAKMIEFVQECNEKKDEVDDMVAVLILFTVMPDRIDDYESLADEEKTYLDIEGADDFDKAWYKVSDTIEWAIECYAQYLCKRLETDDGNVNK